MICCQKIDGNNRWAGKMLANKRASIVLVPGVFSCLITGWFSGWKANWFCFDIAKI